MSGKEAATSPASDAQKRWELENGVQAQNELYKYNATAHTQLVQQKPWRKDPHYFTHVRVSAIALLKMVMHATSGGKIEVMGLMQGYITDKTLVVTDTFALPVEGTETRVNAQEQAYEYMVGYLDMAKKAGRTENVIGWYHSHPGYGCWLSGIDVSTQMLNQQYTEPWLAIVIDPTRTVSAGKVEIGAFRTYPKDYTPPDDVGGSEYQTIPLNKIEDFGVHAKKYYPLDVSYFKSTHHTHLLELLWNKYWVNTLSSSSLLSNREYTAGQVLDLADKLEHAEGLLSHTSHIGGYHLPEKKKQESELAKISRDAANITTEQVHGLMLQVVKDRVFNFKPPSNS